MQAVVMGTSEKDERAKVSSLYFFIGTLGMSLAYLIGSVSSKASLLVSPLILLALSLYLLKLRVRIEVHKIKSEKGVFKPPSYVLFLMAIATGSMNLIVNSEVTISLLYSMFGKLGAGLLLSLASAIGSLVSYSLGRRLLDIKQSPWSLVMPSLTSIATSSPLLFIDSPYAKVVAITLTQGTITWWRGLLVAAARSDDVGTRIGLVNMGRDFGNVIAGLTVILSGPSGIQVALALSYLLSAIASAALLA